MYLALWRSNEIRGLKEVLPYKGRGEGNFCRRKNVEELLSRTLESKSNMTSSNNRKIPLSKPHALQVKKKWGGGGSRKKILFSG